jgi:hypothetical protein
LQKRVVECFVEYMKRERRTTSRAEFEENLFEKESEPAVFPKSRSAAQQAAVKAPALRLSFMRKAKTRAQDSGTASGTSQNILEARPEA